MNNYSEYYKFLREYKAIEILFNIFNIEAGRNPDDELDAAVAAAIDSARKKETT